MSLKVKCFATAVKDSNLESDGNIEIHSKLYMLPLRDFSYFISGLNKECGLYYINILIGDKDSEKEVAWGLEPILSKYAYDFKEEVPIPLLNQPISPTENEVSEFRSSRFWIYQNYFFVINRNYSEDEVAEVKMKIYFIVNSFRDELIEISNKLESGKF